METKTIDGLTYARMIISGSDELNRNRKTVNDLNVFPIPDGDTGDNMFMTINGGADALADADPDIGSAASKAARGMFMGARGNSGVILSRIFAGIAKGLSGRDVADVRVFSRALEYGIDESYTAVAHPVEGTILTVYRDAVRYAGSRLDEHTFFEKYFSHFLAELKRSLDRTPDLLAVLKEAGVVDSGGAGFVYIAQGMMNALSGQAENLREPAAADTAAHSATLKKPDISKFNEDSDLTYGYCTEFILQLMTSKVGKVGDFDEKQIFDYLNSVGESVVAFREGSIIRVHVHTKTPGEILNHMQRYGEFLTLKIENMTLQHNETVIQNNYSPGGESFKAPERKAHKKFAAVAVAAGDGIIQTFRDLGTDAVINGGQSMNPSVKDFIDAFDSIDADNILVFPNNGNVILTAQQAAADYTGAAVTVINNKDIGTGYSALSMLDTSSGNLETIRTSVKAAMQGVITAMVSKANRSTDREALHINNGDYIGFSGDTVYTDSSSRVQAALDLAQKLNAGSYGILMLIRGKDVPQEEAAALGKSLGELYKKTEIISIDGLQPVHDYIMILEE